MLGRELDLMANYPKGKRDPSARAAAKTEQDIAIARRFGREFFDGDRRHGYGGYSGDPDRWAGVVADMFTAYSPITSVLDVGCAKGGMLLAFIARNPSIKVAGVDVSSYAISQAHESRMLERRVEVGNARDLSQYTDDQFDLVVSVNTVHNLSRHGCIHALEEIERVGKRAYVTVDTYRNAAEKKRMFDWNLTAQTILSTDEWKALFKEAGYTGDYGWFIP